MPAVKRYSFFRVNYGIIMGPIVKGHGLEAPLVTAVDSALEVERHTGRSEVIYARRIKHRLGPRQCSIHPQTKLSCAGQMVRKDPGLRQNAAGHADLYVEGAML
jgi:hypothetical protein